MEGKYSACENERDIEVEEDNKDRVKRRRGGERDQAKETAREWETNKERLLVQGCVRKRDGGNIYLSPDESVLGVHLWRNEISS